MKKKNNIHFKILIVSFAIILIVNILSIICTPFAEFYWKYIFAPVIANIFPRITGIFFFSVGEIMIILGIIVVCMLIPAIITLFICNDKIKKARRAYLIFVMYVLVFIFFTETFNCFIMYHTEKITDKVKFVDTGRDSRVENKNDERGDIYKLLDVYNHVAKCANTLSEKLERDSDGNLISEYTYDECKEALKNTGKYYPLLKGYYPDPKKIINSGIMSQQNLEGIYFPFSMEANYNSLMYCVNMPSTICHELCHLKGYIREDEATFLSYIACVNSENDFIRYSGYINALDYLFDDLMDYGNDDIYSEMVKVNEYVVHDDMFVENYKMEKIEEDSIVSTEKLKKATHAFLDTNLKVNGISSGIKNYDEVVKLLIKYYE